VYSMTEEESRVQGGYEEDEDEEAYEKGLLLTTYDGKK